MRFENREHAGLRLAELLQKKHGLKKTVVMGIARGGVPVAKCIADALSLLLDVIVVKKIGAPGNEELAIGAVGPQNTVCLDKELIASYGIDKNSLDRYISEKEKLRGEKEQALRAFQKKIPIKSKQVILVDDGIATGATTLVAIRSLRKQKPKEIMLAVPVISQSAYDLLSPLVTKIITLLVDPDLSSVGAYYIDFSEVTDEDMKEMLKK